MSDTASAMPSKLRHAGAWLFASLAATLLLAALTATPATAEDENAPPKLWKACESGSAAGQCKGPRGIATDPVSGHLYVSDAFNHRMVELTAWGEFVKAWGWGVDDGSAELQTCTAASGCQAGIQGSGVGQLGNHQGVAIDSEGNVYVFERPNLRVQKFSPEGEFLLMFGGGVNQGPIHPGDVCTAEHVAEGDACGAGTPGTANGQFSSNLPYSSDYIEAGPADQIYVGDKNRIQVFNTKGEYQSQLPLPEENEVVGALTVDPTSGDLYLFSEYEVFGGPAKFTVSRIDSGTGKVLDTLETYRPRALASDPDGNVYVFEDDYLTGTSSIPSHFSRIVEFDPAGKRIAVLASEVINPGLSNPRGEFLSSLGMATGSACFSSGAGLYVSASEESFVRAFGVPDRTEICPPPAVPPDIAAEYAISVGSEEASLGARINPRFWTDTTFYVQYGTAECVEGGWEASCVSERPSSPGVSLGGGVSSIPLATPPVFLPDLEPDTTYRYRFVAQSSGGGPTIGAGRGFHTHPRPGEPDVDCPNQALRSGPSAVLPDCRAYELVSPVDKAGGDVEGPRNLATYEARMDQASLSGEAFTYSSYRPFAGALSSPFVSQYIARRDSQARLADGGDLPAAGRGRLHQSADADRQRFSCLLPRIGDGLAAYRHRTGARAGRPPGAPEPLPSRQRDRSL